MLLKSGIGGTLFSLRLSALAMILGKMMEVSAAERIGLTLQRCRWLSVDVIMVLVGLICITLLVEVGVVLLDSSGFFNCQKPIPHC
ncbi:hypothetical protein [Escherichia coli]|uniref:hypothetical protein n=1 Tax=Escherichia coli TaxID=562 RepID=UPI0038903ED5